MTTSLLHHLACGKCDAIYPCNRIHNCCPQCKGPLLARYDLVGALPTLREVLKRRPGQNRLHELGATEGGAQTPTLGEGATPLFSAGRLGTQLGLPNLLIKDEAQNPTNSFKARGMAAAMARAAELGVKAVCLPSAGNAGGAAAAYGALHGIEVHVYIPDNTPAPILHETRALGGKVKLVQGDISDASAALAPFALKNGWFSLATLHEPYRLEGKKVMGFELFYDLGKLPDVILYPTGGGTGLIGMWKAFDELQSMGWIGAERPRMVSVQVAGCAPIVHAFEQGSDHAEPWKSPERTSAFGLRVPRALGDFLILDALRKSRGTAIAVTESELLEGSHLIASTLGLQSSPEGGACVAAAQLLRQRGWLQSEQSVVLFNTGHGAKYV